MAKDTDGPCAECGRKSTAYNGWTNYETWNVALWLGNDQGTANYWQERAEDALKNARPSYASQTDEEAATCALTRELEDEIERGELVPDLGGSMYADLLNAALSEVNYYEIAEHMIEDAKENMKD